MRCQAIARKTAYFPARPCAHKSKIVVVNGEPLCGMHRAALEAAEWEAALASKPR